MPTKKRVLQRLQLEKPKNCKKKWLHSYGNSKKSKEKFADSENSSIFAKQKERVRGRAVVARRAHNPEVVGSSPASATKRASDNV